MDAEIRLWGETSMTAHVFHLCKVQRKMCRIVPGTSCSPDAMTALPVVLGDCWPSAALTDCTWKHALECESQVVHGSRVSYS
jgi:hypothetical protein